MHFFWGGGDTCSPPMYKYSSVIFPPHALQIQLLGCHKSNSPTTCITSFPYVLYGLAEKDEELILDL